MKKLADYWAKDYDWRKIEAKLNSYPQFVTNIDGLDIHFIHVRSKNPNALPVIITHGWPGSVIEQLKVIGPLTDPAAYGGKAEDSFDVVIPSLRAMVFREADRARLDSHSHCQCVDHADEAPRIQAIRGAGRRLGERGIGDYGFASASELLGISTNMPATVPADIAKRSHPADPRRQDSRTTNGARMTRSTSSTRRAGLRHRDE